MMDPRSLPPGAIAVSTEEMLALIGRLYLEAYTLRRQIAALEAERAARVRPADPSPEDAPAAPPEA